MVETVQTYPANQLTEPLVGRFYNVDTMGEINLTFVLTDKIDDRCIVTIQGLAMRGEDSAIVVLYSDPDPEQETVALEAGADDCISLAFDPRYLSARLRSTATRLRRVGLHQRPDHQIDIDPYTHEARVNGRPLPLSFLEFRLLLELRRWRGKVVPHATLERTLWGEQSVSARQSLKQLVRRLRARLGSASNAIVNIPGVGYMLK